MGFAEEKFELPARCRQHFQESLFVALAAGVRFNGGVRSVPEFADATTEIT
jgi:hypothetical protein